MAVIGIDRDEGGRHPPDLSVHSWVDVLHPSRQWLEAQVVDIRPGQCLVHYKGLKSSDDEWIDCDSARLSSLHEHTHRYESLDASEANWALGDHLQVLDARDQWCSAQVLDISGSMVKVHYVDMHSRYDEWINHDSYRLAPIERPEGELPVVGRGLSRLCPDIRDKKACFRATIQDEQNFRVLLRNRLNAEIVEMDYDGNCLFRAISHQVYGDPRYHLDIRNFCCDYMERECDFFSSYCASDSFSSYVSRMRLNGVWGDHLEIQAMSEIYQRPILVYAYSIEPMRTYSSRDSLANPIRLSYHFESHYNSIVTKPPFSYPVPFAFEELALCTPSSRTQQQTEKNLSERIDSLEMESAINESMTNFLEEECKNQSLLEMDADNDLQKALQESRALDDASDEMMQSVLALSEADALVGLPYPIRHCHTEFQVPLQLCIEAFSDLGLAELDNESAIEAMLSFIFENSAQ